MREIFFPAIKWRSSPGQTIISYGQTIANYGQTIVNCGQTNPTSQFNIVEHCWMQHVELVLNEVWFPSNISCNVVQHFCTRARVRKSSTRHGQTGSLAQNSGSLFVLDLWSPQLSSTSHDMLHLFSHAVQQWTPSNKVEFNNVVWCCICLARA